MTIEYKTKTALKDDILMHLQEVDDLFIPKLSSRVNLKEFANKIFDKCVTFEVWDDNKLIGLISGYFNDKIEKKAYINNISVLKEYTKQGIAAKSMTIYIDYAKKNNFKEIDLEVSKMNNKAITFYKNFNFIEYKENNDSIFMQYQL